MSRTVKVKVRPGQHVQFPAECIHCNNSAAERLRLRKRIGRTTRLVDAPLCATCAAEIRRLSAEEERWQKLGWVLSTLAGVISLVILLLLIPAGLGLPLRILAALVGALVVAAVVFKLCRREGLRQARPEKRAILEAAQMTNFSWRATTFEFRNERFAEHFAAVNEPRLMEL